MAESNQEVYLNISLLTESQITANRKITQNRISAGIVKIFNQF